VRRNVQKEEMRMPQRKRKQLQRKRKRKEKMRMNKKVIEIAYFILRVINAIM